MKLHDTPPFAPVLMESTRAMGYSLESAIADIIDNSIAAQASSVLVKFSPYDTMQYVSILDDGTGMNRQQIDDAMRYGSQSSLVIREDCDLGRFGLGLKTASLEEYDTQVQQYSQRMKELEEQQTILRSAETRYSEVRVWLDTFEQHIQTADALNIDDGTILKALVEHIIVNDDGIEIHFKCGVTSECKYE